MKLKLQIAFDFPGVIDDNKEIHPYLVYTTIDVDSSDCIDAVIIKAIEDIRKEGLALDIPLSRFPVGFSYGTSFMIRMSVKR